MNTRVTAAFPEGLYFGIFSNYLGIKLTFVSEKYFNQYIDVDYSSSRNIMSNKLNQLLEIDFCNSFGYVASGNSRLHQASDWSCDSWRGRLLINKRLFGNWISLLELY